MPSHSRSRRVSTRRCAAALVTAAVVLVALLFYRARPAEAATSTTSLAVRATVGTTCTLTGGILNFGSFTPGVALAGSMNLAVHCTSGLSARIDLDQGQNFSKGSRQMQHSAGSGGNPNKLISYDLYKDAGHTQPWGTGTGASGGLSYVGTGGDDLVTVYGLIPSSNKGKQAGGYRDVVVVTINF